MSNQLVEAAAAKLLLRVAKRDVTGIWVNKLSNNSYEVTTPAGTVSLTQWQSTRSASSEVEVTNPVTIVLRNGGIELARDTSGDANGLIVQAFQAMPELFDLYEASRNGVDKTSKEKAADNLIDGL